MNELSLNRTIGAVSLQERQCVKEVTEFLKALPQADLPVEQFVYNGIYTRTCFLRKGIIMASVLIKIPTVLTVCGDAWFSTGKTKRHFKGYEVLACEAGRCGVWCAHEDTYITMSFKTECKTAEEAEKEFTDDWQNLTTRRFEV